MPNVNGVAMRCEVTINVQLDVIIQKIKNEVFVEFFHNFQYISTS